MKFFRNIKSLIDFFHLPSDQRKVTFYSEGRNYWPHLEALVSELLRSSDIHLCYISSDNNDPGLQLKHKSFHAFEVDEGFIRNWLFENIETDMMVMTMPDLGRFQIKRSKHRVHYVYVQHSLVSLHMAYRERAFDNYDAIFCSGPHHIKEVRAMEKKYDTPEKRLVEHGYARVDALIQESGVLYCDENSDQPFHVLLAPSWSDQGVIESGIGLKIVSQLLSDGCKVTVRPHPQTVKFAKPMIDNILRHHGSHKNFCFENNVAGKDSLHNSDVMVSDWSGAAMDYAFGLKKPVVFIDVPKKVNNPDYENFDITPFEVLIREKIGCVLDAANIKNITGVAKSVNLKGCENAIFNLKSSHMAGANYIKSFIESERK